MQRRVFEDTRAPCPGKPYTINARSDLQRRTVRRTRLTSVVASSPHLEHSRTGLLMIQQHGLDPDDPHRCAAVEHWRSRAEEMRTLAEDLRDLVAKATMLDIADQYEKLAFRAEQRCETRSPQREAQAGIQLTSNFRFPNEGVGTERWRTHHE
jgi:hypothetical protein